MRFLPFFSGWSIVPTSYDFYFHRLNTFKRSELLPKLEAPCQFVICLPVAMATQVTDIEVLKDIPGYKAIMKAVLKTQIQMLVSKQLISHWTR